MVTIYYNACFFSNPIHCELLNLQPEFFLHIILEKRYLDILLECNLCTSFALFTSLNIDVLHLIIMFYLCFTFVGAILLIGDKIELKDDV